MNFALKDAPKSLAGYKLARVLGQGPWGAIHEALDPRERRIVVVKTYLKSRFEQEAARAYSAMFLREANRLAALVHPNIARVLDAGDEGDGYYLVTEALTGNLRDMLDFTRRFALKDVVRIMSELLDAIEFAHHSGVIHCNIKPANVMFDEKLCVKLADFEIVPLQRPERDDAAAAVSEARASRQGQYGQIDRRIDVFCAGVILYQLLTGLRPFNGWGIWVIQKRIASGEELRWPSKLRREISHQYDQVVRRALYGNAKDSFGSAAEFKNALRAAFALAPPPGKDESVLHPSNRGRRAPMELGAGEAAALARLYLGSRQFKEQSATPAQESLPQSPP